MLLSNRHQPQKPQKLRLLTHPRQKKFPLLRHLLKKLPLLKPPQKTRLLSPRPKSLQLRNQPLKKQSRLNSHA